jgi:uncharacterized protein
MSSENTFCWIDIPVTHLERAREFYSHILDKPVSKVEEHGMSFALLPYAENNVSGCLCVIPNRSPSLDGPLVYLNVEGRLDHAIEMAQKQGGKVLSQKEQIGPYGHRAIILDTEGNGIALYSKEA